MPLEGSCCISHQFYSAAAKAPGKIVAVVVKRNANFSDRTRARISSSPPVYDGDECFTYADVLSAVDSFSCRLRCVLDGGDDPGLVRPKDSVHGNLEESTVYHDDYDMQHSKSDSNGLSSSNRNPRIVGVHFAPSVEYIVAALSVLRCGEAFLPLDPFWPDERKVSIISSSRTSLVIATGEASRSDAATWIVDRSGCSVLHLSVKAGLEDYFVQSDMDWPCQSICPRKFCYLMYTSGSTGKPKGVCGTEAGLLNRLSWMQAQFPLCRDDVILFKTSISFVDHLQEFLSAILTSAALIVPPIDELKANPLCIVNLIEVDKRSALAETSTAAYDNQKLWTLYSIYEVESGKNFCWSYITAFGISRLTCVPTLMKTIIPFGTSPWMPICKSLKLLVLSGEILCLSLWRVLDGFLPETTILNLYGSTEVSGDCTYFDCRRLSNILKTESLNSVPIGLPISNCEVDLVGETYMPDEGEISVGGVCLFTGYFGDPFCRGPIKSDVTSLSFRTGDFAKRLKTGDLVFLGRKDRTVKVNGQRVALEEIENAMREHPEVSDAAVTFEKSHEECSHLRAFFVMKTNNRLQKGRISDDDQRCMGEVTASVRAWLIRKLPATMIPTQYICADLLPVSATGKIDYAMLSSSTYLPKQPKVEYGNPLSFEGHLQIIKEAFCDGLQVEKIIDNDDFFVMGGNSISAAHVAYKLGIDMRLIYIFPTPFKLLNGLLDQKNWHENFSSYSTVSMKRAKLDDMPPKSDTSKVNRENNKLRGALLCEDDGGVDVSGQLQMNKMAGQLGKNDDSIFNFCTSTMHASLYGTVSDHGRPDPWISELCLPFAYSLSRCNQIVTWDETELSNAPQVCSLIKVLRDTKGCMQELWKVLLKSCVDASPLVVYKGGTMNLYIGSHSHTFLCIDAVSGFVQWEAKLEGRIECSAAITGDFSQVVVGCYKGKIYFLDIITGKISWSFQTGGEVKMQPVLDKCRNLMWCGAHDHCLYALDYVKYCCAYKISCGGSVYGSPSIDVVRNMVHVASTSGCVIGISVKAQPFEVAWSYESGAPIFGSLASDSLSGNVICCLVNGNVLALNSEGHVIWKVTIGGPFFAGACISSALPSQALLCSRNGTVYSLDVEGGEILWEYRVGDPITASAFVDMHSLLEIDPLDRCDRLACVCSSSGRIHVLKINSKAKEERVRRGEIPVSRNVQEFAVMELPGDIFSSPVMIRGRIFVGCRDDYVHCINVLT